MNNICKEARVTLGLNQERFGEVLKKSKRTIIRWEKHPEKLKPEAIASINALKTEGAI